MYRVFTKPMAFDDPERVLHLRAQAGLEPLELDDRLVFKGMLLEFA